MASFTIRLEDAGKKYSGQWIFRHLDLQLPAGDTLAILGPNGSGKSTLLQVLAGASLLNEGKIHYEGDSSVSFDNVYRHVSLASPFLELVEEFTLQESLELHFGFKRSMEGNSLENIAAISGLKHVLHKPVRFFSSGMKQRLKLTLAFLSETPLLFLDEPCTNLDEEGVAWYAGLLERYGKNRTIIVCSNNHKEEFSFCKRTLLVTDYKNPRRQPTGPASV
jgi:ABC-type multidrug transport system ATPase subunit